MSLSFKEMEAIIHASLPAAADRHRTFWSNNPSNNVATKVWLEAGYETCNVDLSARKLVFRRARSARPLAPEHSTESPTHERPEKSPNILERLKFRFGGTVTFAPGFDPTEPTGEIWDAEVS